MAQDAPRRRRARPVADMPVIELAGRGEEIAKGWLLALLEDLPLGAAPALVSESLARDAPRLCAAVVSALSSDEALAALRGDGVLWRLPASAGALTGATDAVGAARAVDALGDVVWSALRARLGGADGDLVTDLAQRLALVCAVVRDAAIEGAGGALAATGPPSDSAAGAEAVVDVDVDGAEPASSAEPAPGAEPAPAAVEPADDLWAIPAGDTPAAEPPSPLWMSALDDEVGDAVGSGRPLSLLLAELEDADRVIASAGPERTSEAVGGFVAALRGSLRAQDVLVCEADARAWVIARDTARAAAHSLGARIAEAVGESMPFSGAPLAASVGIAVLGEDGDSGSELVEAAEQARFTASARGIEVSRRVP